MEILGNENIREDILKEVAIINRNLLSSDEISQDDTQSILAILTLAASRENADDFLFNPELVSMVHILSDNYNASNIPMIRNLVTEVKLRMIRLQCLNLTASYSTDTTDSCCEKDKNKFALKNDDKPERFIPSGPDDFVLPPVGQVTNLTVKAPNPETGKMLIRELIIDHEGYVVEEQSRRYEDIYTDESESIYNGAYIAAIRAAKKERDNKNGLADCDLKTATMDEALENCGGPQTKTSLGHIIKDIEPRETTITEDTDEPTTEEVVETTKDENPPVDDSPVDTPDSKSRHPKKKGLLKK